MQGLHTRCLAFLQNQYASKRNDPKLGFRHKSFDLNVFSISGILKRNGTLRFSKQAPSVAARPDTPLDGDASALRLTQPTPLPLI